MMTLLVGSCVCGHLHKSDDQACTDDCGCSIYERDRGDFGEPRDDKLARMTANCLYTWQPGDPKVGIPCQSQPLQPARP